MQTSNQNVALAFCKSLFTLQKFQQLLLNAPSKDTLLDISLEEEID
jgi:hypothetical protein